MPEILLYALIIWIIASIILGPIFPQGWPRHSRKGHGHFIAFGMGTRENQQPPKPNRARPQQAKRSNHR